MIYTKLKNCPFCGGETTIHPFAGHFFVEHIERPSKPCLVIDNEIGYSTEEMLIEKWNQRDE